MDLWARYLSKVDVRGPDECWPWTKGTDRDGYGIFSWREGKKTFTVRATRWAWKQRFGDIPPGKFICHTCDNPPCQNPRHWFLDDAAGNNADCRKKGRERWAHGEQHYRASISNDLIATIRAEYTGKYGQQTALARKYGLNRRTLAHILTDQRRTS